jgi:hypothetical protein
MKAMKDGRASLMAGIKDNRDRIRVEVGQTLSAAAGFVAETGKANGKLAAQTRQMMAQARRELTLQGRQTTAEARALAGAIRKDVTALRADVRQILAGAHGFLEQTGSDNAALRTQTRRMLAHARTVSKSQARQALAEAGKLRVQTKEAVAGLKTETARVLADATGVMKRLSDASHKRAAGWQDILGMLHGRGPHAPAAAVAHAAPPVRSAAKMPAQRTVARAKRHKRKAA